MYSEAAPSIPLGRVGTESEFAAIAIFLLSAKAAYITGTAINLDSGESASL
ncbi:3-oxoacyl-[acyl-carrier protein] reductase [Rhodococcus wratislaviensis]|uniref:3-oxoacyl-[acyl-carrier protein] reductase n=1 Tax=Rhodococcus wratislaviensis TaxID=44752 RepID=A0A402CKT0_RHOWR|nr:3-oxoacyl-[acyl-carrier protein] reductase [Rhodococcus wratislaviensis]